MSLTTQDVQKIARLARLAMNGSEIEAAREQLTDIFELIAEMQAVDTSGVEPLSHPFALVVDQLALRLRDDIVTETNQRAAYQVCAPATQDGLYLVPRVLE